MMLCPFPSVVSGPIIHLRKWATNTEQWVSSQTLRAADEASEISSKSTKLCNRCLHLSTRLTTVQSWSCMTYLQYVAFLSIEPYSHSFRLP
jgi:hypothetical protein